MSVWISDEKLLIFASLISPSKMILFEKKYQTFDTVFHHQMKHLEVRQKYRDSAARRIFNSLLGVSSGDETLHLMFDILLLRVLKETCKRNMYKEYKHVNQHVCEERDGEKHFCGPNRNIRFWVILLATLRKRRRQEITHG